MYNPLIRRKRLSLSPDEDRAWSPAESPCQSDDETAPSCFEKSFSEGDISRISTPLNKTASISNFLVTPQLLVKKHV